MTADNLATAIYIGLAALVIVGLGSAAFRWAARDVERHVQKALGEQAADFRELTRTEIEADDYWNNWQPFPSPEFVETPITAQMRHEEDVWFAASVLADIEELPEVSR